MAAAQARRNCRGASLPAYSAAGGSKTIVAARAWSRLMRRRLALLVSASIAMVLIAFVIPLAILVRIVAADRAVAVATDQARSVSTLVAAAPGVDQARNAAQSAPRAVTIFLPSKAPVGAPASRTPAVLLAEQGHSFTVAEPGGR